VRAGLKTLRFEHERLLPDVQLDFFRDARVRGFPAALADLQQAARLLHEQGRLAYNTCMVTLGEVLFANLPREVVDEYLPYNAVDFLYGQPSPKKILVKFRSLRTAKTSGGTAYFSRRSPTLAVRGQEKIVAFSGHAIERNCDRTVADWRTYGGAGDAFGFLDNCVYFEACPNDSGKILFTFYNSCVRGFFSHVYASEVLGEVDPGRTYYYRVGYCPADIEGRFVKAITLLTPGMRGTPEHEAVMRSSLPDHQKKQMLGRVDRLTFRELATSRDFSLLRWFHESGVPQVVALDREVFRYDWRGIRL
jgi:hypothetical protein